MTEQLWTASARDLAQLIRVGETSSREVVEAHLGRIDQTNPDLNAVVVVLAEEALAAADVADRAVASGETLGPLHGVPITVKENIDCVGSPTTQGVPALEGALPAEDAPIVERMRTAGAIPIGRTNLPELALRISTDNPLRGLTRNPWHPDLTAGGSSGGEASAIAAGMSPLGLGNDIGGSLRNPAFCCGIASIKPTNGRVPSASSIPPEDPNMAGALMSTHGPMGRSIGDLKLVLELMSGQHARDPLSLTVPFDGPQFERRVGLVTDLGAAPMEPSIAAAISDAGRVLSEAGYEVSDVTPPELDRVNEVWVALLGTSIGGMLETARPLLSDGSGAMLEEFVSRSAELSMSADAVIAERVRLGRVWGQFFAENPAVVGPIWPNHPFEHGADIVPATGIDLTVSQIRFITPGNLLALPSVIVPTGVADGLPTSVQVYADRFREDIAIAAAEAIEAGSNAVMAYEHN